MSEQTERPESEAAPEGTTPADAANPAKPQTDEAPATGPSDPSTAAPASASEGAGEGAAAGPKAAQAADQGSSAEEAGPPTPAPSAGGDPASNGTPAAVEASGEAPAPEAAAGAQDASGEAPSSSESPPSESPPSEASAAAAAAGGDAAPSGEGKKKRRRRKRKKKGEGAEASGEGKDHGTPHGVFARYFEGPSSVARKHAFAAGEVVAGRVTDVHEGAFVVDLFGKALAVVDVHEPREVPTVPEPTPATEGADAPAAAAAGTEGTPATPPEGDAGMSTPLQASAAPTAAKDVVASEPTPDEPTPAAAPGDGTAEATPGEDTAETPAAATPAEGTAGTEAAATPAEGAAATEAMPNATDGAVEEGAAGPAGDQDGAASTAEAAASGAEGEPGMDAETVRALLEPPGPAPEAPALGTIFRGRIGSVSESGHVALVNRVIDRPAVKKALAKAREDRTRVPGVVFGFNRGGYDVLVGGIRVFCPASGMSLEIPDDPRTYVGHAHEFLVAPVKASGQGLVVTRRSILEREARKAARDRIKALEVGEDLEGKVTSIREFGVLVDIGGGVEGLVHQSELTFRRGVRPADVVSVGDDVRVKVLKVTPGQGRKKDARISLSMKALQPDPWDEHADVLAEGRPRQGKVVRATEFGAFVELAPGIEGLLHVSELGKDLKHASAAVKEGDEIDVVVERVDKKQRRVSLSRLSQAEKEAVDAGTFDFDKAPKSLRPGSDITVVVDRVEHGGIAVRVAGVLGRRARGFIPNRELGERGGDVRKRFQPGTEAQVRVVGTDRDGGLRCSFKAKEIDEERKAVQKYRREAASQGFGTFGDLLRAKLEQAENGNE